MTDVGRRRAVVALVVATSLLLAGAAISWYAHSVLADGRELSARASDALDDSDVRELLAERIVGGLASGPVPNALAVRPLVVPVVATLADTSAFRGLFARAVRQRHEALVNGDRTFAFELPVGEGLLFDALSSVVPNVAERIPPELRVPVIRVDPREFELEGARLVVDLAGWRWPLLIVTLLAGAALALLSGGARNALVGLGAAAAGAGLLVAAAVAGLGEFVVSHAASAADLGDESERDAVRAIWDAIFSGLRDAGLVVALAGAVVAALAMHGLPSARPEAVRRLAERALSSQAPAAKLVRAAALVGALGALLVFEPGLFGRILLVVAGAALVVAGVAQLAAAGPSARPAPVRRPGGASPRLLAGAVAATLAMTALVLALLLPGPSAPTAGVAALARAAATARRPSAASGSTRSCSPPRTIRTRPRTNPAGSSPNQRGGIANQLRDGIRAFLIDIHWGTRTPPAASSARTSRPRARTATRWRARSARRHWPLRISSSGERASATRRASRAPTSAIPSANSGPSRSRSSSGSSATSSARTGATS